MSVLPSSHRALHRFTVDDYHRMADAGVLGEDDRVELIEGEIVEMAPIGPLHASRVKRVARFFHRQMGDRVIVSVQDPVRLGDLSEPQPDLALLRPRNDDYAGAHPTADDVLLVVEVADSSVAYDRNVKMPLYAAHGIVEVWLVDLAAGIVEVWSEPGPVGYGNIRRVGAGRSLSPQAFPDVSVAVDDLLA
ncbi:MAG: Uma2 family endonuclease [Acidimicrobiales bacterium]